MKTSKVCFRISAATQGFSGAEGVWPTVCNMLWEWTIHRESFCYAHRRFHRAQSPPRRLDALTFQDSRSAAYGFFPSESQLESVLRALNVAGFENEDLCVLIASEHPIADASETLTTTKSKTSRPMPLLNAWLRGFRVMEPW